MSNGKIFHMGNAVYDEFLKSGQTPDEFADKIGCARGNVYNIFKRQSINAEQLVLISKALGHNFLFDLAMLVEDSANLTINSKEEVDSSFDEGMITIPENKLITVSVEQFDSILEEYIVTEHHHPLIVIAYNSDVADDMLYKKSVSHYGSKGYKMMTDTVNLEVKPYMVPVFMEQPERQCGKDLDTQIGEVVAAQLKSDKHLVFIVNIPECRLMFDAPYNALEEEINRIYELWNDRAHIVCLDATGKLTVRRHLKRYNGYTANHIIAYDFITGLATEKFKNADGELYDRYTVFDNIDSLKQIYSYLVESKQIMEVEFDFSKMTIEKKYRHEEPIWLIHYPDVADPSQDPVMGLIIIQTPMGTHTQFKHYRLIARPQGDYVIFCEGMICALSPDTFSPHWNEIPTEKEFIEGVCDPVKSLHLGCR